MIIEILVMQNYNELKGKIFFYIRHVSGEFAFKELSQLNPYKYWPDWISCKVSKRGILIIPLTFLVNMSIYDNCYQTS